MQVTGLWGWQRRHVTLLLGGAWLCGDLVLEDTGCFLVRLHPPSAMFMAVNDSLRPRGWCTRSFLHFSCFYSSPIVVVVVVFNNLSSFWRSCSSRFGDRGEKEGDREL